MLNICCVASDAEQHRLRASSHIYKESWAFCQVRHSLPKQNCYLGQAADEIRH